MELKARLVEKVSSKSNKPYSVVELELTPNYKKFVFLTSAELELLRALGYQG